MTDKQFAASNPSHYYDHINLYRGYPPATAVPTVPVYGRDDFTDAVKELLAELADYHIRSRGYLAYVCPLVLSRAAAVRKLLPETK
jgi:hypothetical protein